MEGAFPLFVFLLGTGAGTLVTWLLVRKGRGELIAHLRDDKETLESSLRHVQQEAIATREKAAVLEAQKQEIEKQRQELGVQFENLSQKLFEQYSNKFGEQSQKGLSDILTPLKERLADFQKNVQQQMAERLVLTQEIQKIREVSENLTRALRSDPKKQGNWGEMILLKILEASGLKQDEHYTVQGAELGLRHPDDKTILKPDVIVHLPDRKHVIIDAKVSLTHYERFANEGNDIARAQHLNDFLHSVRTHVSQLAERRYQDTGKLDTLDFVLMFMPIEGAYVLALQEDHGLHEYAWDRRIILAGPPTLFAMLKTIHSIWKVDLHNRNAQEIARQGGALYDKFVNFLEDMQKIGKHVEMAQDAFGAAMSKLQSGKGNLINRAEKLKELGAKTSKALPQDLISEEDKILIKEEVA